MTDSHVTFTPAAGNEDCVKLENVNWMPVGKNGLPGGNANGGKGLLIHVGGGEGLSHGRRGGGDETDGGDVSHGRLRDGGGGGAELHGKDGLLGGGVDGDFHGKDGIVGSGFVRFVHGKDGGGGGGVGVSHGKLGLFCSGGDGVSHGYDGLLGGGGAGEFLGSSGISGRGFVMLIHGNDEGGGGGGGEGVFHGNGGMPNVGHVGRKGGGMNFGISKGRGGWGWGGDGDGGDGCGREIGGSVKLNFGRRGSPMGGSSLASRSFALAAVGDDCRSSLALSTCLEEMLHAMERRMSPNRLC